MKKYKDLLEKIAAEFNIQRGNAEFETEQKKRIIYSLLGRTAAASLWDTPEDLQSVSVTHLKRRVNAVLRSCIELYPEVGTDFQKSAEDLEEVIYRLLLNTGNLYHTPYSIYPPKFCEATAGNVVFTRGAPLGRAQWVSGVGSYRPVGDQSKTMLTVTGMFQIQSSALQNLWNQLVLNARWFPDAMEPGAEYLRINPPFTRGYWETSFHNSEVVTLMRTGKPGGSTYYLYKIENKKGWKSQLPTWLVEKKQYLAVANACLKAAGTQPIEKYRMDGPIIHLYLNYLLPPAEQNLIELYSWPTSYLEPSNAFSRTFSAPVFLAIKETLETLGYQFAKG